MSVMLPVRDQPVLNETAMASSYVESPATGLERLFSCTWTRLARPDLPANQVQRVIPDNCADFIVSSDGRAVLVGPATGVHLPNLRPDSLRRGLRIRPHALRLVTGIRGVELRDQIIPIAELMSARNARLLTEALWDWPTGARFLTEIWRGVAAEPHRAETPVAALLENHTRLIVDLAEAYGLSPRQFRRIVEDETGLNPITVRAVARLHRFLSIIEGKNPGPPGLADGAVLAGYADQPHLSREVRRLTGLTPAGLLAERRTT